MEIDWDKEKLDLFKGIMVNNTTMLSDANISVDKDLMDNLIKVCYATANMAIIYFREHT